MSAIIKDLSQTCSMAEWQVRCDLAAFHRLYAHFGWTDLIYTHLTARVPGEPDHYLIKPDLLLMDEVCASDLLKMDMDGNMVEGDAPPNIAGQLIHSAVLAARPDVQFVAHTHTRAGAAVSCMECGVLPLSQHANVILPTVTYHDYQDVTSEAEECAALGRDLGPHFLMMMRNHGILAVGRTAAECFYYLYYLEMACKIQVDVLASGQKPILLDQRMVEGLFSDGDVPNKQPGGVKVWEPLMHMLDRKGEEYRR
ncbi:MAG: class II aldolase [Gammaproteobacteria bacterium]|nr:class II aldolase [Gammaproteobacteria bacterium]